MPVWHNAVRKFVEDGKLVILGVTQEQHPDRCRLFAQWKQFDWPILHDPINVLGSSAVPVIMAIDEHGIVRDWKPKPATIEAAFVDGVFEDVKTVAANPVRLGPAYPPRFADLRSTAEHSQSADQWRALGDAVFLWGGQECLDEAVRAYATATRQDLQDSRSFFRLGVALRQRYETPLRRADDFQAAIHNWGTALELAPHEYIWRRRIQQYGPRLEKPYPFYDWVPDAEAVIRTRGETPVPLRVRPIGAEIASPAQQFTVAESAVDPDPLGRVVRIDPSAVTAEVTLVPEAIAPGMTVRVHVVLRLHGAQNSEVQWNNEAEPLRLWLDVPDGWDVSERLLHAAVPKMPASTEPRSLEFEVRVPASASNAGTLRAYALFHVCEKSDGICRFVRLDIPIGIPLATSGPGTQ